MKDTKAGKTKFADNDTLEYIAELERKCERFKVGHDRYETARRMSARQWSDAVVLSVTTCKTFDQIIDELRPFMFPNAIKNHEAKE